MEDSKMTYAGMRWLKCDLHMHTPIDKNNWLGESTITNEQELADQYAQACLDTGLDVIAITDHNFLSKDFIPFLQEAFRKKEQEGNKHITLFPGFEFEANVGRGVHVLALFPSETEMDEIDAALTECGVSYPRIDRDIFQKSTKTLPDILNVVQFNHKGIVILPHCQSNDGIFDSDRVSDWLQQDQYKNPNLLAVEVPKTVSQMSSGFQKLFKSGDDCIPEWRRIRPIATIMSSDSKQLHAVDAENVPSPNSMGYRFSWIKMSAPSIESLRQAFLDHESRIVLPQNHQDNTSPDLKKSFFQIKTLNIKDALFLDNQEIVFSPNLNTFIGGRGCGKSTILEYLRVLLKKENNLDENTKKKVDRIKETITPNTVLSVTVENQDGVCDTIELNQNNYTVKGQNLADEDTFFNKIPVTFFSQQQITHLTDFYDNKSGEYSRPQTRQLLDLIDGFVRDEINHLHQQEIFAIEAVNDSFIMQAKIHNTQKEQKKLEQELTELERQWKAHHEIEADAKKHKMLQTERILWSSIEKYTKSIQSQYTAIAKDTGSSFSSIEDNLPHKTFLNALQQKVHDSYKRLQGAVSAALDQFVRDFESLKDDSWQIMKQDIDNADTVFQKACEALGLSPDAVGHLQNISDNIEKKKNEISDYKKMVEQLLSKAECPQNTLSKLYTIWGEQFILRRKAAERGNEIAKLEGTDTPFVKIDVRYSADYQSFCERWETFSPQDRRTKLGRTWSDIGQHLYEKFCASSNIDSPWCLLSSDFENQFCNISKELQCPPQEFYQHVTNNLNRFQTLLTSRVQDSIDITLFRADGSEAGCISKGSLSDGQRNTAALVLLLSQKGGGPLIIDQPEDELDSNFVYKELIPMLRRVKTDRQIIVATHNANLPVNGDAELVYALEAKKGHGSLLDQGGLDREKVTQAILDIMEGSKEAFQKRREKYHF